MTDEDLQNLFAPHGEVVSAKIVTDKFKNNRSKGFGFVEMSDDDGKAAISALNETEVDGRKIVVNESQPKPKEERRSSGGFRGGNDRRGGGGGFRGGNSGGGGYNRNSGGGGYNRY
jgi:RNA recognition motif-containing protein